MTNYHERRHTLQARKSRLRSIRQPLFRKWGGLYYGTPWFRQSLARINPLIDKVEIQLSRLIGRTHRWQLERWATRELYVCQDCSDVCLRSPQSTYNECPAFILKLEKCNLCYEWRPFTGVQEHFGWAWWGICDHRKCKCAHHKDGRLIY